MIPKANVLIREGQLHHEAMVTNNGRMANQKEDSRQDERRLTVHKCMRKECMVLASSPLIQIDLLVNEHLTPVLLDTGAHCNIMNEQFRAKHNIKLDSQVPNMRIIVANGEVMEPNAQVTCSVGPPNRRKSSTFVVIPDFPFNVLLGSESMKEWDTQILMGREVAVINGQEYPFRKQVIPKNRFSNCLVIWTNMMRRDFCKT